MVSIDSLVFQIRHIAKLTYVVRYHARTDENKTKMKNIFILVLIVITVQKSFGQRISVFDSITNEVQKLKLNCKANGNNKNILKLLDNINAELMEDENGSLSQKTVKLYEDFTTNKNIDNYHIFYLFNIYQNHITESAQLNKKANANFQITVMKIISGQISETFKTIPDLILLYMGEALISGNRIELARSHFKKIAEFNPQSVPLKVYCYLLSENQVEKDNYYKELKSKHSKHWMVIEKLK